MSEINDSLPLLQQPDVSPDRSALHRRCKVGQEKRKSCISAQNSVDQLALYPEDESSTCYLQHGGATASGKRVTKKLVLACGLAFTFMLFEIVGGYFAGSIAILSDAAHMFSDVLSFVVSVYCMRLIESRADATYSFGYHRAETIGALVSILIVCVITGGLVVEAIQRLANPEKINGKLMFIVSALGIAFNLLILFTLGHDHHVHLGGSCGHDHGHGHSHSHSHHGSESSTARGRRQSHTHSHKNSPPAELNTVRVSLSGTEDEVPSDTELDKSAAAAAGTNGHSRSECHDHKHDHAHDKPHVHVHGSLCGHSHDHSDSQEQPHMHMHRNSGGHDHSHDHHGHDHENQNLRGAIVHVLGDILQSVGVAAAGAIIWYTDGDPNWLWVDPMCTFIFAISVVWVTKTLIVDVTRDLMEAVPSNIDMEALLEKMKCVPGVCGVHDLHVWRIGTGKVILTAHIDVTNKCPSGQVIKDLEDMIGRAGIAHSTVQLCSDAPEAPLRPVGKAGILENEPASSSGLLA